MRLRFFDIALCSDDFLDTAIVSDFNFQTEYISDYVEKRLRQLKFETSNFQILVIRNRIQPKEHLVFKEHFKSLDIEILFNEKKYRELYPYQNKYPLQGLLKPIEDEKAFSDFLISMVIDGMMKAKREKANCPYDFIINTVLDFKGNGCVNEWIQRTKSFKQFGIKVILFCRLTVNYFSLELIIEKGNQELFRKVILKTLPSEIQYSDEFKDIEIRGSTLFVINGIDGASPLFTLPLGELVK